MQLSTNITPEVGCVHTRDLATDKYRKENYDPDLIVNEVGAEQTLYFRQLFEMEKMLGWFDEKQRVHVPHGLIRFKNKKMSTRKGNVVWMEEILEEAIERARKLGSDSDELAQTVAVGAIKWNDLKRDPKTEIVFDWDEMLSMDGNSGPYLQYTYARTQSVMRKVKGEGQVVKGEDQSRHSEDDVLESEESHSYNLGRSFADAPTIAKAVAGRQDDGNTVNWSLDIVNLLEISNCKLEIEEELFLRHFTHYTGIIIDAAKNYSPNLLCNYLYELA